MTQQFTPMTKECTPELVERALLRQSHPCQHANWPLLLLSAVCTSESAAIVAFKTGNRGTFNAFASASLKAPYCAGRIAEGRTAAHSIPQHYAACLKDTAFGSPE